MKEINKLSPFGKFCMTIGHLPASYMQSLSYEEQLLWFCQFLENKVIPTVDNNAEAVEELQKYVSSYFENLDVQDEISVKLDEMAESGVLANILRNFGKWIFIGDSYSTPSSEITSWCELLKNYMRLSDENCIISGWGGAGFANPSHPYYDIINTLENDTLVSDILIAGGYNDLTFSDSNIYNGIANVTNLIHQKFPNAKIHIAVIGGTTNEWHGNIHLLVNSYLKACNDLHLHFIPNIEYVMYETSYFQEDKIHPNQNGQNQIAKALFQGISNIYNYSRFETLNIDTSQSDYFNTIDFSLHFYSNNNISILSNYSGTKYLGTHTDFELNSGGRFKLGKITQNGIVGTRYYSNCQFTIPDIVIHNFGDEAPGYYNVPASLEIDENGIVWIELANIINDEHNGYLNFSAVHDVQIPTFSITYPTIIL